MFILDTDTLTLAFRGNEKVLARLEGAAEEVATSIVNRAEVLNGRLERLLKAGDAADLLRAQSALSASEELLTRFEVIAFDESSARVLDALRSGKKTRAMRLKDRLVACICLANNATLVTRNVKDFIGVPGLKLENWAD